MSILFYVKIYFSTLLVFLGIDAIWLTRVAPTFYKKNIGHLMTDNPNLIAAGVFYLLNIFGILIFSVIPALKENSAKYAFIMGGLYGLFTYATYDLTNYATLKDWPLRVVIVDILWGTILTATVSLIAYYIGTKISN